MDTRVEPVTAAVDILRNEADPVLSAVGSAESEAAFGGSSLGYNAVVVVECLFHGYEDAHFGFGEVGFGCVVPGFGVVMGWELLVVFSCYSFCEAL